MTTNCIWNLWLPAKSAGVEVILIKTIGLPYPPQLGWQVSLMQGEFCPEIARFGSVIIEEVNLLLDPPEFQVFFAELEILDPAELRGFVLAMLGKGWLDDDDPEGKFREELEQELDNAARIGTVGLE